MIMLKLAAAAVAAIAALALFAAFAPDYGADLALVAVALFG
jgi:hypothetical protein